MKTGRNIIGGEDISDKEVVYTSFFEDEKYHCEQIRDYIKNKSFFIKWNKKENSYETVNCIEFDDVVYKPIEGEEINKSAVILPDGVEEYGTDEELDGRIIEHIHKWLDVPSDYEIFAMYNIKLSWVYQRFNTLNYTRALGDTGSGKSRFLFTLGHLHYKPMVVAGTLTPAVIFRLINKWKGTLLIDEGDQESSEETNSFIKIMNCGYEKGMPVSRCDRNDPSKIEFFDVFCPKVITTRKRFDDKATESRCMTAIMVQTLRQDIPDVFTKEYFEEVKSLRRKLLLWRFRNFNVIDPEAGMKVDLSMFEPRLRQVNRSFISLFINNNKQLNSFIEHLKKYQLTIIQERAESFDGLIVNALAEQVAYCSNIITPGLISNMLNNDKNITLQFTISSQKVSKVLQGMGVNFQRKKIEGKTQNAIFAEKVVLETIFSRYVIDENLLADLKKKGYEVTRVTIVTKREPHILMPPFCPLTPPESPPFSSHNHRNLRNLVTASEPEIIEMVTNIQDILKYIKENNGCSIQELMDKFSLSDGEISALKLKGEIYEPESGIIKVL